MLGRMKHKLESRLLGEISITSNMPANLENSAVVQDWKKPVFIPIPKKDNAKEYSNYPQFTHFT